MAESTRDSYQWHLAKVRKTFGKMHPGSIKPAHVFRYRAKRAKMAKAAANREVSVLSSALQFATDQGLIDRNPLRGQISRRTRAVKEIPRTRVPSLEELEAFCKVNPHLQGYVNLKRITGLRQGQLLAINLTEHWEDGALHPITSKGGRDTRYLGDGLEVAISSILKSRLPVGHLFVNRKGTPVTAGGFRSSWRRAMTRFVAQGGERFNEHDIRKTVAVKAKTLEEAQKLLGHQESKTTARVYRIGTEDVEVLE